MVVFFNHYTDIFTSLLRGARSDNMARFVMAANTVRVHGNTYLFGKFGDEKKGNGLLRAAFSSLLFHLHGFCSISGVRHTTLRETNNKTGSESPIIPLPSTSQCQVQISSRDEKILAFL